MGVWYGTLNAAKQWEASEKDKEKMTELVAYVVKWAERGLATRHVHDTELEEFKIKLDTLLGEVLRAKKLPRWNPRRVARFDRLWNAFYDWADSRRIWIKLH